MKKKSSNVKTIEPRDIADELMDLMSSACFEVAESMVQMGDMESDGGSGANADEVYSNEDSMSDMLGDQLYYHSKGDKELRNQIIAELSKMMSHMSDGFWDGLRR